MSFDAPPPRKRGRPKKHAAGHSRATGYMSNPSMTYGEWIRNPANRIKLKKNELAVIRAEEQWEMENQEKVIQLDKWIGVTAFLAKPMDTVAESMPVDTEAIEVGPSSYEAGLRLRVFFRIGTHLLARTDHDIVLKVREEWLRHGDEQGQ